MKFNYTFAALFCAATLFTGCNSDSDNLSDDLFEEAQCPTPNLNFFSPADGAKELRGTNADKVSTLLKAANADVAKGYGNINITPKEAEEIKVFTDDLVKDCKDDLEKFKTIFNWLYTNLDYKHEYEGGDFISNDPYPVFKTQVAICQGFSNLQHIMLESQNIPTLNVNGEYVNVGGHAWNYAFIDNKWWVSDATNNGYFRMQDIKKYKHLQPNSIDANLFETEECTFTFSNEQLNIDSIKVEGSQFVVPYSVAGYKVTSLNPTKAVPTCIKEIYISMNIKDLGLYYHGLEKNAPSIEAAYVSPDNIYLESYSGAIYKKKTKLLYYIPSALKKMELLPRTVLGKNVVYDKPGLEEVIIPNGVESIEDYAFEKCPNLRIAYIPEGVQVGERAFYDVHPDFKIVREDLTGIPEIRI